MGALTRNPGRRCTGPGLIRLRPFRPFHRAATVMPELWDGPQLWRRSTFAGARTLLVRSALVVADHRAFSSASFASRALRTETVRAPNVSSILRLHSKLNMAHASRSTSHLCPHANQIRPRRAHQCDLSLRWPMNNSPASAVCHETRNKCPMRLSAWKNTSVSPALPSEVSVGGGLAFGLAASLQPLTRRIKS